MNTQAVVITAYEIVMGCGTWVTGINEIADGKKRCDAYKTKYPDRAFHLTAGGKTIYKGKVNDGYGM